MKTMSLKHWDGSVTKRSKLSTLSSSTIARRMPHCTLRPIGPEGKPPASTELSCWQINRTVVWAFAETWVLIRPTPLMSCHSCRQQIDSRLLQAPAAGDQAVRRGLCLSDDPAIRRFERANIKCPIRSATFCQWKLYRRDGAGCEGRLGHDRRLRSYYGPDGRTTTSGASSPRSALAANGIRKPMPNIASIRSP